jgi:hypothetical protein
VLHQGEPLIYAVIGSKQAVANQRDLRHSRPKLLDGSSASYRGDQRILGVKTDGGLTPTPTLRSVASAGVHGHQQVLQQD